MYSIAKKIVPKKVKLLLKERYIRYKLSGNQKIFGIGNNKTGTTSLKTAMNELGFVVGHQRTAEKLIHDWANRDFERIVDYCRSAEFFQDVPFSKPYTFVVLDYEFPGSKFILTVRDSPEQWYNSMTKFHAKKWGKDGRIPTKKDLMQATYIDKGWPWMANRMYFNTPEDDPYNKEILIQHYVDYNNSVKEYFRHRPDDLLVLNVAEENAYQKLCEYLGEIPVGETFPWKNKTE
ncbi:MAG: sulfotransferase [Candidatus Paceibacterota bacterium]